GENKEYQYNLVGSPEQIGERRYEYDAHQRPIKLFRIAPNDPGNKTLVATYAYNRFGERIKKVTYSLSKKPKVTYYLYDNRQLTTEIDNNGKITAQYLYQHHRPIIKLEGKTAYAIHTDHLGAPRMVTDGDQTTVWSADYSPFGLIEIEAKKIALNLRLPGQYEDSESGTYYNYYRDYDPNSGRYLTSDPIGLKGGFNTFAYVGGDPLGVVDPLGLYRLVIGIEPPDPSAILPGDILDLDTGQTGHTFMYAVDDRNIITHAISFGPTRPVNINSFEDLIGVPGTADYEITDPQVHLFEFTLTEMQYNMGTFWMERFRDDVPEYRILLNETCTEEVEDMFNGWFAFNLGLPNGSSPVQISYTNPITGNPSTLTQNIINPHGLHTQLIAAGHRETILNTSLLVDASNQLVTGVRDPMLPPNRVPSVTNDVITEQNIDNTAMTFDVLANDSDADGEPISISHLSSIPASVGVLSITADNQVEFTPAANYTGSFTFNYTASDPHGGDTTGTVTVTVSNPPPSATNDSLSVVNTGSPISLDVFANDRDPYGDSLTVSAVNGLPASAGSISIIGNNIVYTPASGYTGAANFDYTITDPYGGSSTANVSLNVSN
ncbi:MAG: Ig-like domain-containing protein, partial [Candidatus Thiodiazotropha sp.]